MAAIKGTKALIYLWVPRSRLPLLLVAVKHFEHIPEKPEDKEATASLLGKIAVQMAGDPGSPYEPLLSLTGHEANNLDFALHMTMADAELAAKFGGMADEAIGPVMLSSMAARVAEMAEVLRWLFLSTQLAALEDRVSAIEATTGGTHEGRKSR